MINPAGAIWCPQPLRNDALAAHGAGLLEDNRAVACEVLIERDTVSGAAEEFSERGLALFEWLPTKVIAIQFDQVEGTEHGGIVKLPVAQQLEHRLTVDILARRRSQIVAPLHTFGNEITEDVTETTRMMPCSM